jgi:hypothetical protein
VILFGPLGPLPQPWQFLKFASLLKLKMSPVVYLHKPYINKSLNPAVITHLQIAEGYKLIMWLKTFNRWFNSPGQEIPYFHGTWMFTRLCYIWIPSSRNVQQNVIPHYLLPDPHIVRG